MMVEVEGKLYALRCINLRLVVNTEPPDWKGKYSQLEHQRYDVMLGVAVQQQPSSTKDALATLKQAVELIPDNVSSSNPHSPPPETTRCVITP